MVMWKNERKKKRNKIGKNTIWNKEKEGINN